MPANEAVGQAKLAAKRRTSILEEFTQGLDQLQLHARRQPANIVMALDGDRGPPVKETLSITSG